jgi:bla regulator protein blaR1
MSIFIYLIKVNLAILLFGSLYIVAFRNLSFFRWNRFYLLGSVVLSMILPLLRLQWKSTKVAVADLGGIDWTYMDQLVTTPVVQTGQAGSWSPGLMILLIYMLVSLSLLIRSVLSFRKLHLRLNGARKIREGRISVYVQQNQQRGSFTLFRRIYLDPFVYRKGLRHVLRHEMVHAIQFHSLDLLFLDFVITMLWFNPFVFVLRRYVRENHEYLADHYAHYRQGSLVEYLECLKIETVRYFRPVPASFFKSSTIKKRIIMLTNRKSNSRKKLRYLGILPLLVLSVVLFHTPADQSLAIQSYDPAGKLVPSFQTGRDGIPAKFPLPEKYRGTITWAFNQQAINPVTKKNTIHKGIDVAAPTGTPVYASADGIVREAESKEGWGKLVMLCLWNQVER